MRKNTPRRWIHFLLDLLPLLIIPIFMIANFRQTPEAISVTFNGVTYNNTDLGSQLLYSLYKPINEYFNFNNVFTFQNIYDWIVTNILGNQPSMVIFIAWNVFLYEFIMDLVFLLYGLFMFFIDFCTNLIEKFHYKASGGK